MADTKSYLLWYHSNSHGKDRFFLGSGQILTLMGAGEKPQWSYAKDEAFIFSNLADVQSAKAFCEKCKYENLQIEPIDTNPVWAPPVEETINE